MLYKKLLIVSAASLFCTAAFADSADFSMTVTTEVPTAEFYVTATPDWNAGEVQTMNWSEDVTRPSELRRNISMKSTHGEIKAYLNTAPELLNGADSIPLNVTINNTDLGVGAVGSKVVMDAASANVGGIVPIAIVAANTARPTAGRYNGTVNMMFESEIVAAR